MPPVFSVVFITVPDAKTADLISGSLLKKNLAACVNQIPLVKSKYWWKGKIEEAQEVLLIVKTRTELIPSLTRCVKEKHPYAIPEVIGIPVTAGYKPYLQWLETNTRIPSPLLGAHTAPSTARKAVRPFRAVSSPPLERGRGEGK